MYIYMCVCVCEYVTITYTISMYHYLVYIKKIRCNIRRIILISVIL